jgi:hypothetical protein
MEKEPEPERYKPFIVVYLGSVIFPHKMTRDNFIDGLILGDGNPQSNQDRN